jgi:type IV pilus assembly protein PilB
LRVSRKRNEEAEALDRQEPASDLVVLPDESEPRPARSGKMLGDLLVERQLLTPSQLAEALLQQPVSGKRLGALLVELGALDELELARSLAAQHELPLADLRQVDADEEAISLLPESVARAQTVFPIRKTEAGLEVAMADPMDQRALKEISTVAETEIIPSIAPESDINRAIDRSYRATSAVEHHVEAFLATEAITSRAFAGQEIGGDDAPVVQVVNLIITQGVRDRASDIHIEPQDSRVRIRYRIDGALHDALALPANMGPAVVSRVKVIADMDIVERRRPQDGQITMDVDGRKLDIRVATTSTIWGEKAVLRLLDQSRALYRLHELGMDEDAHTKFSKLIRSPFGMVICAGPTGSGKTTTLYAALAEVNQSEVNIMTVEDPVEYILPSINQIQIQEGSGITFAGGLKAILRQDPDVILVGEMRDVETARIGIQSALTGHLVLTSLHATDAVGALQRFLDMDIEPFLVASSVIGVVGQRLVRRICPYCRTRYTPTPEEMEFFEHAGGQPGIGFFHGEGCNFCFRTGYEDRIGVYELLRMSEEMKQLVMKRAPHKELRDLASSQGMKTLVAGGVQAVTDGTTTISEVMRSIYTV